MKGWAIFLIKCIPVKDIQLIVIRTIFKWDVWSLATALNIPVISIRVFVRF